MHLGTAWIDDVRQGGTEVLLAPGAASKALLLVWPYEGVGTSGWDAEALERYTGDTICYVGDWQGCTRSHRAAGMTSSVGFQRKLSADFVCVERVAVGKWAMVADMLSVWRRRRRGGAGEGEPEGAGCGPLAPSPDEHCRNCHLDRGAPGVDEGGWPDGGAFCSADCAALYRPPAAKRRRDEFEEDEEDAEAARPTVVTAAERDEARRVGGGGSVRRERDASRQGLWWKRLAGGTPAPADAAAAATEPAAGAGAVSFSFGF